MATTEPIRNKNQIRELAGYYLNRGQIRNYVLIVLAIHTALRISDLLLLKWDDVYDFSEKGVRNGVIITEKKTGKSKMFALNSEVVRALKLFSSLNARAGVFLFENMLTKQAISRIQAYRIIRAAADSLNFPNRVSCHSLRKTFGYHAWKNGASPAVIMEIYNHSSLDVTRRYLGVTQDDKDFVYLGLRLIS